MNQPLALPQRSERLFEIIRELASDGIAILYVSHRLDEILNLCSTISVFKDGEKVLQQKVRGMTKNDLIHAIVGAEGGRGRLRKGMQTDWANGLFCNSRNSGGRREFATYR